MIRDIFFLFLIGCVLGATLINLFTIMNIKSKPHQHQIHQIKKNSIPKMRIICILSTAVKYHKTKAIHVKTTWGKNCDKLIFATATTDLNINAMDFNITDNYSQLWGKTKRAMYAAHIFHMNI